MGEKYELLKTLKFHQIQRNQIRRIFKNDVSVLRKKDGNSKCFEKEL